MTLSIALNIQNFAPVTQAAQAVPVPTITSESFNGATVAWQVTTDMPNAGNWHWARILADAPTPTPDGAGGWATAVLESGTVAVGTNGTNYSIPTTGASGETYKLALYQRVATSDSNVLMQIYTESSGATGIGKATEAALVLNTGDNRATYTTGGFTAKGGPNNCLVLQIAAMTNVPFNPGNTVVTYAGQPCAIARADGVADTSSVEAGTVLAYLMNPPTTAAAAATITFKDSSNGNATMRGCAVSIMELSGIDATAPVGAQAGDSSPAGMDLNIDLTPSTDGSWAVVATAALGNAGTSLAPTPDTTTLFTGETGTSGYNDTLFHFGETSVSSTSAVLLGTTRTNIPDAAISAVEFIPA